MSFYFQSIDTVHPIGVLVEWDNPTEKFTIEMRFTLNAKTLQLESSFSLRKNEDANGQIRSIFPSYPFAITTAQGVLYKKWWNSRYLELMRACKFDLVKPELDALHTRPIKLIPDCLDASGRVLSPLPDSIRWPCLSAEDATDTKLLLNWCGIETEVFYVVVKKEKTPVKCLPTANGTSESN